jgi:cell wall-associated NlpC family hydrolase
MAVLSKRRKAIVYAAWWGYLHRDQMHYTNDSRRYQDQEPPPNFPNWTDCSGFANWCYKCAKAASPGSWTGDMQNHGKAIPPALLQLGDLVFFGDVQSISGHVGIVVGNDWMIDFGSEAGPKHQRISKFYKPVYSYRTYPV